MIKIFTVNSTCPQFVELQLTSFKKNLQEDFEYVVFNGEALNMDPEIGKEVSKICRSLSVRVVEIQRDQDLEARWSKISWGSKLFNDKGRFKEDANVSSSCADYMQYWAWEKVISKEQGSILFTHSDMFLTEPIKLTDYLKEYPLCFVPRIGYPLPGVKLDPIIHMGEDFVLADISRLPSPETMNWFPALETVEGRVTIFGGCTYYWLHAHPEIKWLEIPVVDSNFDDPTVNFHPARYQFLKLGDKRILHYLSGSQVPCRKTATGHEHVSIQEANEYHKKKMAWARQVIEGRITVFQKSLEPGY